MLHDVLQVANDTIIMLIGLVYCVIQPIIAPLAMIYFLIGMLIWKYQVVYVYVPLVESGGKVSLHTSCHAFSYQLACYSWSCCNVHTVSKHACWLMERCSMISFAVSSVASILNWNWLLCKRPN